MIAPNTQPEQSIYSICQDITTLSDDRTNQFKHLIDLNHQNFSILYNNYRFHNHSPHFLGSAYLYGGSTKYLQAIYDDIVDRDNMDSWRPSPGRITNENYRAYLGKGEYQRAWVDFFEDMMIDGPDGRGWQDVAWKYLLEAGSDGDVNSTPVVQCLNTALGHPLIHLGYAFELNSRELAAEALGLVATCYDEHFAALLSSNPGRGSATAQPTSDLFDIFERIHSDRTLPCFSQPGDDHIGDILSEQRHKNTVVSYVNSWTITDSTVQLSQIYYFASLLLVSTSPQLREQGYDFFLVHMLTTAHAVRVLLPHLPTQYHTTLLKEWLLTAVLAYVAQNRPKLDPSYVKDFELQGRDWEYVRRQAIESKYSTDAHYVKACRALHVAAQTWKGGEEDEWFLRCAVRFVSEFDGWGGFDTEAEDAELVKGQRKKDGIYVR